MEPDKLTQLAVNTMNVRALVDQLKIIQGEQQQNIQQLHIQAQQIAMMASELATLKQTVFVMRALSRGPGPTT